MIGNVELVDNSEPTQSCNNKLKLLNALNTRATKLLVWAMNQSVFLSSCCNFQTLLPSVYGALNNTETAEPIGKAYTNKDNLIISL